MKYSACIEMLFTEVDFVQRIRKARDAGFDAVEFWLWQNKDIAAVKAALDETGVQVGIFQGNTQGRMVDAADKSKYVDSVLESVETAKMLGAKHLFLMSDILKPDRTVEEAPYEITPAQKRQATLEVLRELQPIAEKEGITFVIEPLNVLVDHMGYSLDHSTPAFEIIREINSPNVKVLYDMYHMQIMEGNIIPTIKNNMDAIGYVHIADTPGRNEPGTGELNVRNIFRALEETNYDGLVGFEFDPTGESTSTVEKVFAQIRSAKPEPVA